MAHERSEGKCEKWHTRHRRERGPRTPGSKNHCAFLGACTFWAQLSLTYTTKINGATSFESAPRPGHFSLTSRVGPRCGMTVHESMLLYIGQHPRLDLTEIQPSILDRTWAIWIGHGLYSMRQWNSGRKIIIIYH